MIRTLSELEVLMYQLIQCPVPSTAKRPRVIASATELITCSAPKVITARLSV